MNQNIKKLDKSNCETKHKEMIEMGMCYCPVCDKQLKDQAPIIMTIQKNVTIIYRDPEKA